MKYFVIFLVLIGFVGFAHATEPEPVGVDMIEYGIFDPNDNNTHLLKVGTTYDIKAHFQSELDKQVSFKFLVQVQDKDKHWTEPVEEFVRTGTLYPNESKRFSFSWTPQYQGEFRTYVEVSNPTTNTAMGYAPQFDFEVIQPNTDDPFYDYSPTYRIMNLKDKYSVDEPIRPYILKKDLDACNAYRAEILKDDRRVWEYTYHSSCIMAEESFEIESEIQIPTTNESIKLSEAGHYTLEIEIGSYELQESFSVEESEQTPKQFSEDTDWISIPVVGEYRNWELPKEPDIFNLQYRIINGTITDIESVLTLTVFDIASNNSGQIQLKIPKNYPFTNYPQDGRERDSLYVNIDETRINTESVVIEYDDCFYNYSIPFKKDDSTIEVGFSKTLGFNPYVIEEVPNYCIENVFAKPPLPKHIAIEFSPLSQTQLGISSYEIQCRQNLVLVQKYDGTPACVTESTKTKLVERGWTTKDSGIKCDNNDDFDLVRFSESDDIHPQRLVVFLKEGTTGIICLQYISNLDNEGFFDIDESLHQRDSSDEVSSNVVLNAIPNKVSREYGTDVTVTYEIHAKNNSTGIYWINLSQLCDSLPVVVWDEEPRVSEDDIPVATGVRHCPAKFLDVNIIGYSGLDLQYHSAKPT